MEGRWTLYRCPATGRIGLHDSYRTCDCPAPFQITPVVPCDDAAVERAARAVSDGWAIDEPDAPRTAREIAEAVLRAAGETP